MHCKVSSKHSTKKSPWNIHHRISRSRVTGALHHRLTTDPALSEFFEIPPREKHCAAPTRSPYGSVNRHKSTKERLACEDHPLSIRAPKADGVRPHRRRACARPVHRIIMDVIGQRGERYNELGMNGRGRADFHDSKPIVAVLFNVSFSL